MLEAGFDQKLLDQRVNLSVMGFHNQLTDAIRYVTGASCKNSDNKCYMNADEMESMGVETKIGALVYQGDTDSLDAQVGYTYTVAQFSDKDWKDHAVDKASPHVANVSLIYGFDSGRGSVRADGTIKSRGWEEYHKGSTGTKSGSYYPNYDGDGWKVDIAAQYEVLEGLTVYGRVENLFDSEYYTSSGYTDSPFGVYVGLGYKF
jgi:vitamin B12 transporter